MGPEMRKQEGDLGEPPGKEHLQGPCVRRGALVRATGIYWAPTMCKGQMTPDPKLLVKMEPRISSVPAGPTVNVDGAGGLALSVRGA